jgi:3-oxoacid CoA-transferase subunit A
MIYITGDMHGSIQTFKDVINKITCKSENTLIVLGDLGVNYYINKIDKKFKSIISQYNINLFVIRGNHDANPANLYYIKEVEKYGNIGYIEEEYPNIFYAKNGEIYIIENNTFLVLGGAYSVDKWYRLEKGYKWFEDEQMTEKEKQNFWSKNITKVDTILSHTCPYSNRPIHLFLTQIDQSSVDNSMENFLDEVKLKVQYKNWFFGHYHADEKIEKNMYMLYNGVIHYKPFKNLKIY